MCLADHRRRPIPVTLLIFPLGQFLLTHKEAQQGASTAGWGWAQAASEVDLGQQYWSLDVTFLRSWRVMTWGPWSFKARTGVLPVELTRALPLGGLLIPPYSVGGKGAGNACIWAALKERSQKGIAVLPKCLALIANPAPTLPDILPSGPALWLPPRGTRGLTWPGVSNTFITPETGCF